jgi:hypothetical protein
MTVHTVIVGADGGAVAATIDAVRRGIPVLVVIRSGRASVVRRFRQSLRSAAAWPSPLVTIVAGAEVACVDGVNGVEAVVVRQLRTGRLIGVNARAVLRFPPRCRAASAP